ncbi:hypothetical protein [Pseudomonas syringae]|uniref:hypothetical protein n=1 Tax=Pseudomonas syringae TaxID=317 RepID=UPI001F177EF3|nr:hypothetical protein [Pseudomonas syringae]MCF5227438.1 hypothetical protein [Pseudomonas syringae]MCF5245586.1 hypothetical protein [Pseudomonas syringae]
MPKRTKLSVFDKKFGVTGSPPTGSPFIILNFATIHLKQLTPHHVSSETKPDAASFAPNQSTRLNFRIIFPSKALALFPMKIKHPSKDPLVQIKVLPS